MNKNRVIKVQSSSINVTSIIYVMHNTFRIENNHALYQALKYQKPLSIYIVKPFDQNKRTLDFFYENLGNYQEKLTQFSNKIELISRESLQLLKLNESTGIVMDMCYMKEEKELYDAVLNQIKMRDISFELVETNTIIPVTETSNKEEYSARTIRSKINKKLNEFIDPVLTDEGHLHGEKNALDKLQLFSNNLDNYNNRNNPGFEHTSQLSPYLKYGFISPLTIYLKLKDKTNTESFLEEVIVRRDLSYNFIYYNNNYDCFYYMTYPWAYQTMRKHEKDERAYLYKLEDYLAFKTHDPYFNTAMKEMVYKGTMHGYMRMYWCKKIVEWSETYLEAYQTAIYLNNHYFIDGNTPNGYTGVAWCFGKHDRAWKERDIFGKLRYMNLSGLERKFDMDLYVHRVYEEVKEYE